MHLHGIESGDIGGYTHRKSHLHLPLLLLLSAAFLIPSVDITTLIPVTPLCRCHGNFNTHTQKLRSGSNFANKYRGPWLLSRGGGGWGQLLMLVCVMLVICVTCPVGEWVDHVLKSELLEMSYFCEACIRSFSLVVLLATILCQSYQSIGYLGRKY